MIVMLNAETWSDGLWNYEEDREIEFSETTLTEETKISIINWKNEYEPYTASQGTNDVAILTSVTELDKKGVDLVKQIANEWKVPEIDKYYYYSVVEDKLKFVLYKDGTEKFF